MKLAAVESSGNKRVCEDLIKKFLDKLKQMFNNRPLLQLPNYEMCQKLYDQHYSREKCVRYDSILISGPKGCGKTTSLYQLYLHLQRKPLYVDLLQLGDVLDGLSDVIREYNPDVLLIDNVQEFDSSISSRVAMVPFIVAAMSPAGRQTDGLKSFEKCRRKCVRNVSFSPLDLKWAKHFLIKHEVKVEDEPAELELESELYSEFEQHDNKPYYLDHFKKIKERLKRKSQQATSNQQSATSNQEEEEGSEHQKSLTQTAMSDQEVLKQLTSTEFLKLFYETGGIPRYLFNYVFDLKHTAMYDELERQIMDVCSKISDNEVAQRILKIALSGRASPMDYIVSYGIAYRDEATNKYHISSPYYVRMALQLEDPDMESRDWHKLEQLTLFFLRYQSCSVSNHKSIEGLPKSTKPIQKQIDIGVVPPDAKDGVTVIYLAAGHPVIDAILVDCVHKTLYFVQTSFLSYSKHKKKMEDVFHTAITRDNKTSVYDHYINIYKGYHVIYVYATPQQDETANPYVYFMDLRHVSAFNRWQ